MLCVSCIMCGLRYCCKSNTYMPRALWPCGWPASHIGFGQRSRTRPHLLHFLLCVSGSSGWTTCRLPVPGTADWWLTAPRFYAMWPWGAPHPGPDSPAWAVDLWRQSHHWAPSGKTVQRPNRHLKIGEGNIVSIKRKKIGMAVHLWKLFQLLYKVPY